MLEKQALVKRKEMDDGPFLLVIVRDSTPVYQWRISGGSGFKKVNIKTFDTKQAFRRRGIYLHATNDNHEFQRDLVLLRGDLPFAQSDMHACWSGEVRDIRRDVAGVGGWASLSEFFSVLNSTVEYVVLRNFEDLPDEHALGDHEDIDFLVSDVDAVNRVYGILNGRRGAEANIGGKPIYFDLRSVEDFYYDPEWCRRILRERVSLRGLYAPSPEDHFFSLLYHGHVHKPNISQDYPPKLVRLARQIGLDFITEEMVLDPTQAAELIRQFLKGNRFYLTRPNGCPHYNPAFVRMVQEIPFLSQSYLNPELRGYVTPLLLRRLCRYKPVRALARKLIASAGI